MWFKVCIFMAGFGAGIFTMTMVILSLAKLRERQIDREIEDYED